MTGHDRAELVWPTSGTIREFVVRDWRANPRDPKARFILVALRITQLVMRDHHSPAPVGRLMSVGYRLFTEFILSVEIRPKTRIGPGLSIYHGYGVVLNDHCILGADVQLRNGVTIGHARPGGGVPRIGARASFGANSVVIGDIEIGDDAVIGAGAVVTKSVPQGGVAVGNPARILHS